MKKFVLVIFLLIIFSPLTSALIKINEVELNPQGSPDTGKEWIELYSEQEMNLTNWKIMSSNGRNMSFNISFSEYSVLLGSYNLLTDNENKLFLINNNGEVISETPQISDTSNDDRTWQYCNAGWLFESSTKGTANLCPVNNSETNQTQENQTGNQNNTTNQAENKISESSLSILAKSKSNFSNILNVDVDVYRGNTDKYALYIYIENKSKIITEKFIIHLNNKYTNYSLQIPIYIEDNCKYNSGEYQLIAEGLELRKEVNIELIRGSSSPCLKIIDQNNTTKIQTNSSKNSTESILNQKNQLNNASSNDKNTSNTQKSITGNVVYESKKKINNKQITFLLLATLVCLLIYSLITAKKQRQQDV